MEGSRYHASRRKTHNRALSHLLRDMDPSTIDQTAERAAILAQHILKAPGKSDHRRYGVDTQTLQRVMETRSSQAYLDQLRGQAAVSQVISPPPENYQSNSDIITP